MTGYGGAGECLSRKSRIKIIQAGSHHGQAIILDRRWEAIVREVMHEVIAMAGALGHPISIRPMAAYEANQGAHAHHGALIKLSTLSGF